YLVLTGADARRPCRVVGRGVCRRWSGTGHALAGVDQPVVKGGAHGCGEGLAAAGGEPGGLDPELGARGVPVGPPRDRVFARVLGHLDARVAARTGEGGGVQHQALPIATRFSATSCFQVATAWSVSISTSTRSTMSGSMSSTST